MRRLVLVCTLLVVTVTVAGLWAQPIGEGDGVAEPVARSVDVSPVTLPEIASLVQQNRPDLAPSPSAAAAVPADDPARLHTDQKAEHLVQAPPVTVPEVIAVVTTTTTTTTTSTPVASPPTTTAAVRPAPTVAFTAAQTYGSCGEDIPYDVFSGTAAPGSTVTISSPHGAGTAIADGSGHWEGKVEFPMAPRNEPFAVDIAGVGGSASFAFVATGPAH